MIWEALSTICYVLMTCSAGNTARRSFWWPNTVARDRRQGNVFGSNNVYPYSSSYSLVGGLMRIDLGCPEHVMIRPYGM